MLPSVILEFAALPTPRLFWGVGGGMGKVLFQSDFERAQ